MKLNSINASLVFFLGCIVGSIFTIGIFLAHLRYNSELTNLHKTFGDIEIWAQKPIILSTEEVPIDFYTEADRLLWMTKDGAPFLMISKDANDKISGFDLTPENCTIAD